MRVNVPYHTTKTDRKAIREAIKNYLESKKALPLGGLVGGNFGMSEHSLSISHKVIGFQETKEGFEIELEILDTPSGKILKEHIMNKQDKLFAIGNETLDVGCSL